jgi:hypothetical protein
MRLRTNTSVQRPPRSMVEVINVLRAKGGQATLLEIANLKYTVAKKDDQPGDVEADKDWGVSVVEENGIPARLKKEMMRLVLLVDKVRCLATDLRDDRFFDRIFINRMSATDDARQQRQGNTAQHVWHTDATFPPSNCHLTVVLTLYNSELDSDAISAKECGGYVKLSDYNDGRYIQSNTTSKNVPKAGSTSTYYPKTNSFYIFPGYFVAHAVFKVKPETTRYSVVMMVKLRKKMKGGVIPDTYLRREWAASNAEGKEEICERCWGAFGSKKQLVEHQTRSQKCMDIL